MPPKKGGSRGRAPKLSVPNAKDTATHHGTMEEAGTAGVTTADTIHIAMTGNAKDGWNPGHTQHGRKAAKARLGTNFLIAS